MCVLHSYVYVYQTYTWCLQRPEEGLSPLELDFSSHAMLGTWVLWKRAPVLLTTEPLFQPQLYA